MPQIDYAKLAAQARQPVDYAALAEQARMDALPLTQNVETMPVRQWTGLQQKINKIDAPGQSFPRIRGFLAGSAQSAADLAEGVTAGAASTVFGGGDLIRRGMGMERVIDRPEVQLGMTPPTTFSGQTGFMLERGGEFAVPLSRVSRATAGLPILGRMAAEGAASTAVAGVQSGGDVGAMTLGGIVGSAVPVVGKAAGAVGGAIQRGAAGAKEGGVGGAIASVLRTVAPPSPKQMVIQAVKPRSSRLLFKENLDTAMREVGESVSELGVPITNTEDTLAAIAHAKTRVRADYDAIAGPKRLIGSEVDLTPVATAMVKSIPTKLRLERPEAAEAIERLADRYRRNVPLADAERYLVETNAELESYYAKFPASRRAASTANPETALTVAQATTLRNQIYQTLEHPGQGQSARELNRRYGTLMELENELTRRVIPAARLQPESLAEQISTAHAVGQIVRGGYRLAQGDVGGAASIASGLATRSAAKFMKEQQTTDALLRRAFASYKLRPIPVAMPPASPPVAGLLGTGARPMGSGPDPSGRIPSEPFISRVIPRIEAGSAPPSANQAPPRTGGPNERGGFGGINTMGQIMGENQVPFNSGTMPLGGIPSRGNAPVQTLTDRPPVLRGVVVDELGNEVGVPPRGTGEYIDAEVVSPTTRALPRGVYAMPPSEASVPAPPVVIEAPVSRPAPTSPVPAKPVAAKTVVQATTPKKVVVDTPKAAASEVTDEINRVIDVSGTTKAIEIKRRVLAALMKEMEPAKKAFLDWDTSGIDSKGRKVDVPDPYTQTITITIPDNGTFRIKRTPDAIAGVIKRVTRASSTAFEGLGSVTSTRRR